MPDVIKEGAVYATKKELAKRWRVKTRTIELWVRQGKIPAPIKPSYRVALWDMNDVYGQEQKWGIKRLAPAA